MNPATDNPTAAAAGDIVIIATPDSLIRPLCERDIRKRGFRQSQLVLHLSGTHFRCIDGGSQRGRHLRNAPDQTLAAPLEGARLLESAWYCPGRNGPGIERARRLAKPSRVG